MGETPIRLLVPSAPLAAEILPYLERIDAARWYSNFGPLNQELEAKLGENVCTVSSATLGLQLAISALPSQRILVPSFTYPATICAIVNAGKVPVFCDVELDTWAMSPEIIERSRSLRIHAAMPVCPFGAELPWTYDYRDFTIVIDAAAAYLNQANSSFNLSVFSLHATKYPGAGEGGFVVGDADFVARVRKLSRFGMFEHSVELPGTNAKLSEYHAAVALASLANIEKTAQVLTRLKIQYLKELSFWCEECQTPPGENVFTSFSVLLPRGIDVAETAEYLGLRGIETRRWYYPLCHNMPAFKRFPCADDLKNSREISSRLLGLPFHVYLSQADISRICSTLKDAIRIQRAKNRKAPKVH